MGHPVVGAGGDVAFGSGLSGPGTTSNDRVLWRASEGAVSAAIQNGQPAVGADGLSFSAFFGTPEINNTGQMTVFANASDGLTIKRGIWISSPDDVQLVALSGAHAPGTPPAVQFASFFDLAIRINDPGRVMFWAHVIGEGATSLDDHGIWSNRSGALELVAREGDPAPGTPAGVALSGFFNFGINDTGQIAFMGVLRGASVTPENEIGLWASDPEGIVHLIARQGDQLEVAPGDLRTIVVLHLDPGGEPYRTRLNNLGQVAFVAYFADGTSGVFIAQVPEPSSISALAIVFLSMLQRSKRRERISA